MYEYSKSLGLVPVFITLTLPSKYHKHKIITLNNGKQVKVKNNNFDEQYIDNTPKDLVQVLSNYFDRVRYLRAFRDIPKEKRLYFKIIEPHKTGTPHLHSMLYIPLENLEDFKDSFKKLCRDKLEIKFDIQTDILNPVNYLIKYILKNIDDYRYENTSVFKYSPLALWYIRWGIRRFSMSRNFVRIDLYRKLNGKYTLLELTNLVKNKIIDYLYKPETREITNIILNDDLLGELNIWSKREQYFYESKEEIKLKPKIDKKIYVKDENGKIIAYLEGDNYVKISNKKPLSMMSKMELWQYEKDLLSEFDNPFNDEEDLDILFDKLSIFDKYIDEDYNYDNEKYLNEELF